MARPLLCRLIYGAVVAAWAFAALCISAKPAYAYVDPGSGLFLLQIVGSTVLGFTFLIRKRVLQFLQIFTKKRKAKDADSASV